jgi:hypothetical protein
MLARYQGSGGQLVSFITRRCPRCICSAARDRNATDGLHQNGSEALPPACRSRSSRAGRRPYEAECSGVRADTPVSAELTAAALVFRLSLVGFSAPPPCFASVGSTGRSVLRSASTVFPRPRTRILTSQQQPLLLFCAAAHAGSPPHRRASPRWAGDHRGARSQVQPMRIAAGMPPQGRRIRGI